MWVQAIGIGLMLVADGFGWWAAAMTLLGLGTALVYPTFLAAIADVASAEWRASAVGVYRLWRDLGYAVGALTSGLLADRFGLPTAIGSIGLLTFVSGGCVLLRMRETLGAEPISSMGVK
jgi:MFS family permease